MTLDEKYMLKLKNEKDNKIVILIPKNKIPEILLIWNFNSELEMGVRECLIKYDQKTIFDGILKKGNFINNHFNYYTAI